MAISVEKQFVTFFLGKDLFGINIFNTQEIVRTPMITPVPHTKEYIFGIINLRGDIIPIVDLEKRFSIPSKTVKKEVIVLRYQLDKIGILVDSVYRVIHTTVENIAPPPAIIAGVDQEYLLGITKLDQVENTDTALKDNLIIILDAEKMFFLWNDSIQKTLKENSL